MAAPILLIVLRISQGLAIGGEWAGATLLTAEYAPPRKRGRYALFPQLGPSLAFALASATFLTTGLTMSDEAFLAWGLEDTVPGEHRAGRSRPLRSPEHRRDTGVHGRVGPQGRRQGAGCRGAAHPFRSDR